MEERDRILDKVRALLAKAESTQYAEEAAAYTAKAQELIATHAIDIAVGREQIAVIASIHGIYRPHRLRALPDPVCQRQRGLFVR